MAGITLRADQVSFVNGLRQKFSEGKRIVLGQAPTGFGKTATASVLLREAVSRGRRCMFVAHLDAIVGATERALRGYGLDVGRIQAGHPSTPDAPIQVCSLWTLDERNARPPADLIIVDEAHHWVTDSAKRIVNDYQRSWILGLSATPGRSDDTPLGDVFQDIVCGPTIKELIRAGVLVRPLVIGPNQRTSTLAKHPIDALRKYAAGRQSAVFLSNVADARQMASDYGFGGAVWVGDTDSKERDRIERGIADGSVTALFTVNALLEGFDAPALDCVVLARGFSSTVAYIQAVGRGLRACPQKRKKDCLVIDLTGSSIDHGLPDMDREWSITGKRAAKLTIKSTVTIVRCRNCFAIFERQPNCPRCDAIADHNHTQDVRTFKVKNRDMSFLDDESIAIPRAKQYVSRLVMILQTRGLNYKAAQNVAKKRAPKWVRETLEKCGEWTAQSDTK